MRLNPARKRNESPRLSETPPEAELLLGIKRWQHPTTHNPSLAARFIHDRTIVETAAGVLMLIRLFVR